MARTARLTPRFLARRTALGITFGSPRSRAIGATIAALAHAELLPGALDYLAPIPPVQAAFVRRVTGENLWLWFRFDDVSVTIVNISSVPPTPAD